MANREIRSSTPDDSERVATLLKKANAIVVGKQTSFFTDADETMLFVCPPKPLPKSISLHNFERRIFEQLESGVKKDKGMLQYTESRKPHSTKNNAGGGIMFAEISYEEPSSGNNAPGKETTIIIYPSKKIAEIAFAAARKEYDRIPEGLKISKRNPQVLVWQLSKKQLEFVSRE